MYVTRLHRNEGGTDAPSGMANAIPTYPPSPRIEVEVGVPDEFGRSRL